MLTQSRVLRHLDAIRRAGSIREAARHLHISSSALNRQLLQFEAELGFPLFDRMPQGLRLTPGGEIVARHILNVLQDEQRMSAELDALKGVSRGTVDIASVESLTSSFIPAVLEQMLARHPAVKVSVAISGSDDAAAAVAAGNADVAIAFVRRRSEQLRQLAAGRFLVGAIVPAGHALARRKSATFAECARHPLVLPTPEFSIHDDLRPLLAAHKRPRSVVLHTGSVELMKSLAASGIGIAFINRFGIERELRQGLLRHIPLKGAGASFLGIYVRAGRSLPPAVGALVRIAADEIARRESLER